jgi:hypothetical protein
MVLDWRYLCRSIVYISAVVRNVFDVSIYGSKSADVSLVVAKIKVAVSVTVGGTVKEDVVAALDEVQRVLWLYTFLIVLGEDGRDLLADCGIV